MLYINLFVNGFCGDTFKSCVFGHAVFIRSFDFALDKRNNIFDEFVGNVVAFFVDPFTRNNFFCVCNIFKVNKNRGAFVNSVFGVTAESNHFSGFAGNGGFNGKCTGHCGFVTVGFGSGVACASLKKRKFDSANFCTGFCADYVRHGCGKTAKLAAA